MKSLALFLCLSALTLTGADGIRLECVADNGICAGRGEQGLNLGGKSAIRLKGIAHFMLLNFDVSPLRGRVVEEARLYLRPVGPHKLRRIGISTVAAAWREGTSRGAAQPGESCFAEAAAGERPWAGPGSDIHAVIFGAGGAIWFTREIEEEPQGWISVEVPPPILHAMMEGNSHGCLITDESGQSGSNNDVYAREQSSSRPYLLVRRSHEGAPPASGAQPYAAPRATDPGSADHASEIVGDYQPAAEPEPLNLADGCELRILHEGAASPDAPAAGRLWNGHELNLEAARGEHIGFLMAVRIPKGESRRLKVSGEGWGVRHVLPVGEGFDPLIALAGVHSGTVLLHAELWVPKTAAVGVTRSTLTLATGNAQVEMPVTLRVHPAMLPDDLSFQVSLNGYTSPGTFSGAKTGRSEFVAMEREAHRLAHEHRCTIAIVPYSHRGQVDEGMAPEIERNGAKVSVRSWQEWDARFAPLFSGAAFQGLPREGVPLEHFYLPMHEQWPLPIDEFYGYRGAIEDHWRLAPPIEEAFPADYGAAFAGIVRDFAVHIAAQGWSRTDFHVYFNNKNYIRYERKEPAGSWWCLDEPMFLEDFLALRYFGQRFRQGLKDAPAAALRFRIDLSRPQWNRGTLDGLVDLNVISGVYRKYPRMVFGREGEEVWGYGSFAAPPVPAESVRAWLMQLFLDGATGAVPWQTLGTAKAWTQPEGTAIILPPQPGMPRHPVPTLRLKLARRGQQDAELLALLLGQKKWSRPEVRRGLAEYLRLRGTFTQTSADDAGQMDYTGLEPDRFESLRRAVLEEIKGP